MTKAELKMTASDYIPTIDEINLVERDIEDRLARRDGSIASVGQMLVDASADTGTHQVGDFIIDVAPSAIGSPRTRR